MANWSELPLDLIQLIANLTNINSSNTRHFRSVCTSWRTSILPKPSTYFVPPTIKFFTSQGQELEFRLVIQTTYLLSPCFDPNLCWVVKVEEHKTGFFHLLSPFSKSVYVKDCHRKILDLTNVNTLVLGTEYVLRNVSENNSNSNSNNNDRMSFNDMENEKVAVSIKDGNGNFTLLSTHNSTGKLLMYWSTSQRWAFLDDLALGYDDRGEYVYDWSLHYVDVAEYEGAFYAVTNGGRIVVIECSDEDDYVTINLMKKSIIGGDKKYLVKSDDDLLLLDLYTCPVKGSFDVNAIDVYKLDKEDTKWVLLTKLGGRTIFLSKDSSFCASHLHGLKENCIYFSFENARKDFSEKKSETIDYIENYSFSPSIIYAVFANFLSYKHSINVSNKTKQMKYNGDEVDKGKAIGVFDYDKGNFWSREEEFEGLNFFCFPPPSWVNLLN